MATSTPVMPTVRIENTGVAQTNIPFTFGQVFAPGHFSASSGLAGVIDTKTTLQLQVDVRATHPDGSVRHAIISGGLPKADAGQIIPMVLVSRGGPWKATTLSPAPVIKVPPVAVTVGLYDAYTSRDFYLTNPSPYLSGPVMQEWQTSIPLTNSAGENHPHLTVLFGIRVYANATRIETVIENNKTFQPGAQNFEYEMVLTVPGQTRAIPRVLHFHHARSRHIDWIGQKPSVIVHPDTAYLMQAGPIESYSLAGKPSEKTLADWAATIVGNVGPMKIGPVNPAMPATGGRPDIAPLPGWAVCYLLSHDKRAYNVMMAAADGSGSWPIHYRDENTGYPVRLEQYTNFSTHMNIGGPPLPTPRTIDALSKVPYGPDTAHQPSLAFLPYLLTGDYFYLEELQFWAAWNPAGTDPANHGRGLGLVKWQQLRGQAWSLRTLGHAAYITPDAHPLKGYFAKQVQANIDWYHETYVVGNPNPHGMYDGSGKGAFPLGGTPAATGCAPFQDDYFTWALGYLVRLGFEAARPVYEWKAQFAIKRMTSPDFCWIQGADFYYTVRKMPTDPILPTMGAIQETTYGGDFKDDNRKVVTHPNGSRYLDQPCGSQAQADWIKAATGQGWWIPGRMLGYADSVMGYPANMQPALAIAVDLGVPGAAKAWLQYDKRAHKPDWAKGPQFNVVPRALVATEQPAPPVVVPPVVVPPVVVSPIAAPKLNARTRLEIAIQAHSDAPEATRTKAASDAVTTLGEVLASERAIVQGAKK